VDSEKFLWGTKVGMRFSMFNVEECIQNEDLELTNTKNTTIALAKGGDSFFMAHIGDKEGYKKLVDIWTRFIDRTIYKVKQLGYN
jgi:hypothetical protein